MKFKVVNKTMFKTRDLRSFVTRAYRCAETAAGPQRTAAFERNHPCLYLTFARSNRRDNGASTGHAYLGRPRAHVGVHDQPDRVDLALTIAHEFGHCLGLDHANMRGGPLDAYHWRTEDHVKEMRVRVFGWGALLSLEKTPPKTRKPPDRLANICERLNRWESRAKRANTAIKKLRRTKARLERRAIGPQITAAP